MPSHRAPSPPAPRHPPGGARRADRYRGLVPVLAADGLTKTVGSGRAARLLLNGVSLSVDAGEVVAVLGRRVGGTVSSIRLSPPGSLSGAGGVMADRDRWVLMPPSP